MVNKKKEEQFEVDVSSSQVLRNSYFVALKFFIYIAIGLFFVPYLVGRFGTTGYGLIVLAGILNQYIGLVSSSISNSINRFVTVALTEGDANKANVIFNSALHVFFALFLLQIPFYTLGVYKLEVILSFPEIYASSLRFLVVANAICFGMNMMAGGLVTTFVANNRIDTISKIETVCIVFRTILLFAIIEYYGANLIAVGCVELTTSLFRITFIYLLFRREGGPFSIKPGLYSREWFRPVIAMSGWMLLSTFGFILFLNTDVWLLNKFVSPSVAGMYAALLVWPNFIKQLTGQVNAILLPVFTIELAKCNVDRVAGLCVKFSRVLVLVTLILTAPLVVAPNFILHYWKHELLTYYYLMPLIVFYLAFTVPEGILWSVFQADNKMHIKGRNDIICGVLNIVFSYSLIKAGMGEVGVAVGTAVALILRNAVLTPIQVCQILNTSFRPYMKLHFATLVMLLCYSSLGEWLVWDLELTSIGSGVFWFCSSIIIGIAGSLLLICGWRNALQIPELVLTSVRNRRLEDRLLNLFG